MSSELITDWTNLETFQLIKVIDDLNVINQLDKNTSEVFINIANKLFEYGHVKTFQQCKNKWKELITAYNKYKLNKNGMEPPYFKEIDNILLNTVPTLNTESEKWSGNETEAMISIIKNKNYLCDLKTKDQTIVYEKISKELFKLGYQLRDNEEIKLHWLELKKYYGYYIKGAVMHFKYFDLMDNLLDWEPGDVLFDEYNFPNLNNTENGNKNDKLDVNYIKKKANNWTHKEMEILLSIINLFNYPNIKREQLNEMYDEASQQLRLNGYKRSSDQCKIKFKHLKKKYFDALKSTESSDNPENKFEHFQVLHKLLNQSKTNEQNIGDEEYEVEYLEDSDNCNESKDNNILDIEYLEDSDNYVNQAIKNTNRNNNFTNHNRTYWTNVETSYLLFLLKSKNVKPYSNCTFFEEIGEEMKKAGYNRTSYNCMVKWKNLRSNFKGCLRKKNNRQTKFCPYYNEIEDILTTSEPQYEFQTNSDNENETIENDTNRLKRKSESKENEHLRKKIKNNPEDFICNPKMDDIEHYCFSLAAPIKRLSLMKQAKLKIEIQKLLYQAEFDNDY